ncbi:hypothetical protein ES332_D07G250100v1 [Gossypium tomentosum]|uniref:Pentacotripeptide-repeat region of PRORP domain-containing protein n=1 Tax=Gossypium tomentosum TaxID=34277 RepID=A0A5D2KB15_GOSTO|nr:hypothetical protein ES332_D07G250100v1 [Gossypium tomentosum]
MIRKRPNDRCINRHQQSSTTFWSQCVNLRSLKQIHAFLITKGFNSNSSALRELIFKAAMEISVSFSMIRQKKDVVPWSALTSGYAKRGELDVARRYFDDMPVKDLVSWNVMITGYAKRGEMESARKLFNEVLKKDVVTWNAMIAGYVLSGECKKALEMFEEMKTVGERPDEVTMLSLLNACADLGDLQVGMKIHWSLSEMVSSSGFNVLLGNALIDMYAKCGSIGRALKVFQDMREKDVSTWNSVIGGLAIHGHAEESINLFTEMRRSKVRPNEITFVGVLVACSHAGRVNEGVNISSL